MTGARKLHLYADESGNTGPDLVSRSQPLEVTAMVLLSSDQERALAAAVSQSVASARTQAPQELKFARLARTPSGQRVLHDVMDALHDCGGRAFFSITEKRFLAASLIVETFLDPLWTRGAPEELLQPSERRKAANLVYQVSDDTLLSEFLRAWRSGERDACVAAGERVARRLEVHPADEGPRLAIAIARGLNDPYDWASPVGAPPRLNRPTPNTFTFLSLLGIVDRFLRSNGDVAELIADEDAQFGQVLAQAFRLAKRKDLFPGGVSAYGVPGPITQVVTRAERHSEAELGIQVADLVAGLVAAVALADVAREPLGDGGQAWVALRRTLTEHSPTSWWQVSERVLTAANSFEGLAPGRDDWWWGSL